MVTPVLFGVLGCSPDQEDEPIDSIRVMLLEGQSVYHGNWPEVGDVIMEMYGGESRFDIKRVTSPPINEDLEGFAPAFDEFDVVVSTYDGARWTDEVEASFEEYMSSGGGFISIHAADNAFADWDAYNLMIGIGGWGGRTGEGNYYVYLDSMGNVVRESDPGICGAHGDAHKFTIDWRASHPITAGAPKLWTHYKDELYESMCGPAENITVLASAFASEEFNGNGQHQPVLMTVDYGNGRIFHSTLGHDPASLRDPVLQQLLLRATEWAADEPITITFQ